MKKRILLVTGVLALSLCACATNKEENVQEAINIFGQNDEIKEEDIVQSTTEIDKQSESKEISEVVIEATESVEQETEIQDSNSQVTEDLQAQNDEVNDNSNPYKDILDEYYQAIYEHQTNPKQWDTSNYVEKGLINNIINPYWSWGNTENMLSKVGFAFVDLNEDGIDELVLGWIGNEFWNMDEGYVFAVYTIVDGKATLAIEGWERCLYVIGKDGYLYNSGSNSSEESIYTKYSFSLAQEDFLEPVEEIYSYYSYDDNKKLWEHITNPEDINVIEYKEKHQDLLIDENKALTMGEAWMESGIEIDYTLFSAYDL
jgi:hypothetical protein